jgi:hypothetical protein
MNEWISGSLCADRGNLYIANGGVVAPAFWDGEACRVLQKAFPEHEVISSHRARYRKWSEREICWGPLRWWSDRRRFFFAGGDGGGREGDRSGRRERALHPVSALGEPTVRRGSCGLPLLTLAISVTHQTQRLQRSSLCVTDTFAAGQLMDSFLPLVTSWWKKQIANKCDHLWRWRQQLFHLFAAGFHRRTRHYRLWPSTIFSLDAVLAFISISSCC